MRLIADELERVASDARAAVLLLVRVHAQAERLTTLDADGATALRRHLTSAAALAEASAAVLGDALALLEPRSSRTPCSSASPAAATGGRLRAPTAATGRDTGGSA